MGHMALKGFSMPHLGEPWNIVFEFLKGIKYEMGIKVSFSCYQNIAQR